MLDFERLAYLMLTRDLPDLTVASGVDETTIDELPFVTYSVLPGQSIGTASGRPVGWDVTLSVSVVASGAEARDAARTVYDAVWGWADPFSGLAGIAGVGSVDLVDDQQPPTRSGTSNVPGHDLTQYDAVWTMRMLAP